MLHGAVSDEKYAHAKIGADGLITAVCVVAEYADKN
jgi:hypothetical protein